MGSRLLLFLVLFVLFFVPSGEVDGMGLGINSTIPEYIMEDHFNLTGYSEGSSYTWKDSSTSHFAQGEAYNVTINGNLNEVRLAPSLDIQILNGGNGVLQGDSSAWDKVILDQVVIKLGLTYYMYYTGGATASGLGKYSLQTAYHIGVATSSDGLSWTKYSGNPILSARVNSYDYTNLMFPTVLVENGTFHMYYAGNKGNTNPGQLQDISICYANSTDGFNFTKYSQNPVLKNGAPNNAWNGLDVRPTSITRDFDGKLRLYFKAVGVGQPSNLGGATSTDFKTWTLLKNAALYSGSSSGWEDGVTNYNGLELHSDTYRMWTHADRGTWKVGWIWSEDGEEWTDSGSAVISPKAGTIYANDVENPSIVDEGDHFRIYTTCWDASDVRRVACFKATEKGMNGTFRSRVRSFSGIADLDNAQFKTNVTGNASVQVYFRWSNDSINWTQWVELDGSWKVDGISAQYIQYKAEFETAKDWLRPGFKEFSVGYTFPITVVEISVDGGPWQDADGNITEWYSNLSLVDGDYMVIVRATDTRGINITVGGPFFVDLYPPTGNITIEDGRYAHNSTWVKIDVEANDTHEPIEMQMARTPDFSQATWWPHYPSNTYGLLDEPEGNVTIYLRLRDAAGRISETYNDTIVIDTTPPEGTLLINDGAKYTNSTTVTLSWSATDLTGVVGMMASNDPDFGGAIWEDPMSAFSWMIGEADGTHTVYLKIRDFVGWETVLTDDIILDRTPPAASLSINQDAPFTTSMDVTLNITLYDENPISFKIANLGEPWPDSWRSTGSPVDIPWTLSSGPDGQRTVSMLVRDAASNEFIAIDEIALDTTHPVGTLVLNDGDPFTNMLLATATLTASDATSGLNRMRISDSDDFTGASWQTVKETFTWPLPSGDGTKTVFVQLRDVAGLVSTIDATIILDTVPPEGTVSIDGVDDYSGFSDVELDIDMRDDFGLDMMMVSADAEFTDAIWVPYSTVYPWDLGNDDGQVTVFVRVSDLAGNIFTASVSTILDTTPAEVTVEIPEFTLSRTVEFTWSATDNLGMRTFELELLSIMFTPLWETSYPLDGVTSVNNRAGSFVITEEMTNEGLESYQFIVSVRVEDLSGWSGGPQPKITFIPEVPKGTLVIDEGAEWTNSTQVDVSLTQTGGLSATYYRVALSEGALDTAEWIEWGGATTIDLGQVSGERAVWGQLKGAFDILSEAFSSAIMLDMQAPVVDIVSPTRSNTEDDTVRMTLSVSDDQDPAPAVEWRLNGGDWKPYEGDERLSLKEGDNLIEVNALDAAGNMGTAEWTISSDRGFSVGGASWLILLVIVVVVALVGLWYWRSRTHEAVE
jgi:hypothetical protein